MEGTAEELRAFQSHILSLARKGHGSVFIKTDVTRTPLPYEVLLEQLVVAVGSGPTLVRVVDSGVEIVASAANLERLASFVDVPAEAGSGWHAHYEHYPGNEYIAANSEPTTFSLAG